VTFREEALNATHHVVSFDCGKPELDIWLRESALHTERNRTSRTFVWVNTQIEVVAYYSLAAHLLRRDGIGKLGRGSPSEIPAVLLARLALDRTLHGQKLGGVLLVDALERALTAGDNAGARFVVVDAIDDNAANFYIKHGFSQVPDDPHRLIRKMSSIAVDLTEHLSDSDS
jgi:GNAT superfamily N-acetyltransferase